MEGIAEFGAVVILASVILYIVWTIKPLIAGFTSGQNALLKRLEASDTIINRNSDVLDEGQSTAKAQTTALEKLAAEIKTDGEREGAALQTIGDGLRANTDATTAQTSAVGDVTTALNTFSTTFSNRMEALEAAVKQRIPPEQVEELLKAVRATTVQELSQITLNAHDANNALLLKSLADATVKRATSEVTTVPDNGSAAPVTPTPSASQE